MLQKEISSKDSLLNEISGSISSNQKKLEEYRNNLKEL
jgi:peptidoglycan hydrolase CwlO-like protein